MSHLIGFLKECFELLYLSEAELGLMVARLKAEQRT